MRATKAPLVSCETLQDLEESLGGESSLCHKFVCRFIDMWPGRFERLQAAVTSSHHEDALDAALSLRSSSMMVGGLRLGALTTEILRLVESGAYAQATMRLASLERCGNETTQQLSSSYVNAA